jgi:alpha-mannosidase
VKRDEIAWIGTHRHDAKDNQPYVSSYLFEYTMDLPAGTKSITLPSNDALRIMAVSVEDSRPAVTPAGLLYVPDITAQTPRIPAPPAIKK